MNIENQKDSWVILSVLPLALAVFLTLNCGGSKENTTTETPAENSQDIAQNDAISEDESKTADTGSATLKNADTGGKDAKTDSASISEEVINVKADIKSLSRCKVCHSIKNDGKIIMGPSLFGVFGRKAGSFPKFQYSKALKAGTWSWTEGNLLKWLTIGSKKAVKTLSGDSAAHTKMTFPALKADKAKAIIAALKTLK